MRLTSQLQEGHHHRDIFDVERHIQTVFAR